MLLALAISCWRLAVGCWILGILDFPPSPDYSGLRRVKAVGYWLLDIGHWILAIGYWILDISY
jgi:hypothetical protein